MQPVVDPRQFEVAVARLRRERRLRLMLPPLALVVLTLSADAMWRWRTRTRALQQLGDAWSAYATCLLGPPLRDGEHATSRLRRIEVNLPEPRRGAGDAPWPARCAYHLDEMRRALTKGRLLTDPKLTRLDEAARTARDDLAPAAEPDLPDHLWGAAGLAGLPPPRRAPGDDAPAPDAAEPLTTGSLAPLPVEVLAVPEEADRVPSDGLRLLFAAPAGDSALCSFRPDAKGAPFQTAHCAENVAPTATDDATPGFVRSVKGRFDRFELIRPMLGADPQIVAMPAGTLALALFSDQLVSVTSARHLLVRAIPQGPGELGASIDLGSVAGASPELSACRTETSLVVRVRSYEDALAGPRMALTTLAFRTGDAWERAPGDLTVQADADFTCRGREATFTWLERDSVHQARCTPAGCAAAASEALALPWESGRPNRVSDVDGQAIVVGIGMTAGPLVAGSVKTVRMRIGALTELSRARDVVLLGDPAHDGVDATDVRVFVRRGAALVLVTSDDREPFRAISVGSTGTFAAVHAERL